jgi:hypothetical protein
LNIQEIERGITKLKRRVNDLEQLKADNARHDDPAVEVVETNISNTVLEIFGKESKEYEQYQNHEIWHGDLTFYDTDEDRQSGFTKGIEHSLAAMNGLISRLEEKKEDLSLPVQSTQVEHVVKGEGVSDWNSDFYRMLKDGGWVFYEIYRRWFKNDNIRKHRLLAAIDNKKVNFRLTENRKLLPQNFLNDLDSYRLREFIDDQWSLRPKNPKKFGVVLEAESLLAWLKENYPLEETEQMKPVETAEDTTSDNLQTDSQGLSLPLEHEFESSLLKIAVECWKALYEDAGPDGRKIRKKQIEAWVQEHYSEVSANSRKTISAVVNPFKTGGASPSE